MDRHHSLGFKQFASRGLRQVAVCQGYWLALLGEHRSIPFRRLHRIGNQTRFLVLPAASGIANRASRILGQSLQRRSED